MDLPDNQRDMRPLRNGGRRSLGGIRLSQDTEMTKDLKVRLPMQYHMKLQTLKILKGKNMSDSLCEALDAYFAQHAAKAGELALA
ncbi:MAG: hypothetical protein QOE90_1975 [Thermoplasmata archaeon]|nr:hypothetical protein [Thermoplasmata archaeon]